MELFAAGFNAWNQLSFDDPSSSTRDSEDDEPRDLHSFQKILQGREIERPTARLSYTIVRRDEDLLVSGFGLQKEDPSSLEFLASSAETATGEILALDSASGSISAHPSFTSWKSSSPAQSCTLPCDTPAKQIAAYDAGFIILHRDGTVSTLGDPRFQSSLGREPSPTHPAHSLATVPDLNHLLHLNDPIIRIAAGGLSLAALTASGSLYVWGTPSRGTHNHRRRQPFPPAVLLGDMDGDGGGGGSSGDGEEGGGGGGGGGAGNRGAGVPNYMPVAEDKDVRDVALGESHAIALTADRCVYVIGDNTNGQLGLAAGERGQPGEQGAPLAVDRWTRVPWEVSPGWEVVGVAAGPRASFILTSRKEGASGGT